MALRLYNQNISFWALMAGGDQTQFIGPALLTLTAILVVALWIKRYSSVSVKAFAIWCVCTVLLFVPCGRFVRWPMGESSYQILITILVMAWLVFTKWGLLQVSWNGSEAVAASGAGAVGAADEHADAQKVSQYRWEICLVIILSIMAAILRFCLRDDVSGDYRSFLEPWYQTMQAGGIHALGTQVGDYNLPYQTVIYLMTLLPIRPLYAYKLVSCIFDYLLAWGICRLTRQLTASRRAGLLAYAIVLFFPQVYIDSAHWAQCDAIYVTFLVWAFGYYLQDHYRRAFFLIGIAMSFKLQAVFMLPFYGLCWLIDRRHAIARILWIVPGFYLCCIPGIVMGRTIIDPFLAYLNQTTEYSAIRFNFPSFWGIFFDAGTHSDWNKIAILLTAAMLLVGMILWIRQVRDVQKGSPASMLSEWLHGRAAGIQNIDGHDMELLLRLAIWSIWTCVLFLPNMHERYAYALDMLLIVLFVVSRDWKEIPVIGLGQLCSLMCYGTARLELPNSPWLFRLACLTYTVCYVVYVVRLFSVRNVLWSHPRNASTEHT